MLTAPTEITSPRGIDSNRRTVEDNSTTNSITLLSRFIASHACTCTTARPNAYPPVLPFKSNSELLDSSLSVSSLPDGSAWWRGALGHYRGILLSGTNRIHHLSASPGMSVDDHVSREFSAISYSFVDNRFALVTTDGRLSYCQERHQSCLQKHTYGIRPVMAFTAL